MRRLIEAAAGAGLLVTALTFAAPLWWGFELLTHFRVQLVAALCVLALAFVWRRAWPWVVALAAGAAVNAAPVAPYLTLPRAGATGSSMLTILGVNVQFDNDAYAGLLESIAQVQPDVLVVVEFTKPWRERIAGIAASYPYRFERPRADAYGVAVWSRYPLDPAAAFDLGSATAVDAVVETPRGPVRLYAVHLLAPTSAARAAGRNAQLDALAARLDASPEPVVVIGDFNLTPYSPYFTRWLARTKLRDARRGFGLDFTWPSYFPPFGIPIDHCVVSAELDVTEYRRLPAFGSDHHPVLVRLAIG